MRKRRGESLAEFLTASLVFGIIMAGLFEFMANQTENLAMIRDRDDLMFYAQKYINKPEDKRPNNDEAVEEDGNTKYHINDEKTLLTVTKENGQELNFSLKP
ncbi:MAG: prepilin-type N-terminal cleavage/methylation domain-containing protein [Synergistaceae bacterium]|nr:prepilin-type N-terminal cleavage/methylation domain-containing protein [Synergistaceae bacterium]